MQILGCEHLLNDESLPPRRTIIENSAVGRRVGEIFYSMHNQGIVRSFEAEGIPLAQ